MLQQKYLSVRTRTGKSEYDNAPLASPWRRIIAFSIDVVLLIIPSIVVAAGVALAFFYFENPEGFSAVGDLYSTRSGNDPQKIAALETLAPLMDEMRSPGFPCAASEAVAQNNPQLAAEILSQYDISFNLSMSDREPIEDTVTVELGKFIPNYIKATAFFGVAMLYFTFFTAGKRNQTIGKKLTRIMVVAIYGGKMSWRESFRRFAGYMASIGMLGFGFIDLFRDPNRQLIHDRIVDTAVIVKQKKK